jgi:hypothetical protein
MHHAFIPQIYWNDFILHISVNYKPMKNEMVMHQLTPFRKPNKKLKSGVIMDYLIPQTKHSIGVLHLLFF